MIIEKDKIKPMLQTIIWDKINKLKQLDLHNQVYSTCYNKPGLMYFGVKISVAKRKTFTKMF